MNAEVITVSSKGQVVLPAQMRNALSISPGDKLVAYASGDSILLKPLTLPKEEELAKWLDEAQAWAEEEGISKEIIPGIIKRVRARQSPESS